MRFKVRGGFSVHRDSFIEVEDDGRKVKQPRRDSYYGGQMVNLEPEQAAAHAHTLEPTDKESAAFLSQYHKSFEPGPDAPGM